MIHLRSRRPSSTAEKIDATDTPSLREHRVALTPEVPRMDANRHMVEAASNCRDRVGGRRPASIIVLLTRTTRMHAPKPLKPTT